MTAAPKPNKPAKSFREREHRFTKMPVKDILKIRMSDLDVKNVDMQKALGYAMPNVIAMMKTGSMPFPINKTVLAAKLLQLDPVFLLGKLIEESDAGLWDVIKTVMGDRLVSANEMALIESMRAELDGFDLDLAHDDEFIQATKPILKARAKREDALRKAAIAAIDREKQAKP
jgi:hypothetical protein